MNRRLSTLASLMSLLVCGGCEPYAPQMAALLRYGGHGPPAGYDPTTGSNFAMVSFTPDEASRYNESVNDRSFPEIAGYLKSLPNLTLDLSWTRPTDASVPLIAQLRLMSLNVEYTAITPRALLQLHSQPRLEQLSFTAQPAAKADVEALKQALNLPIVTEHQRRRAIVLSRKPLESNSLQNRPSRPLATPEVARSRDRIDEAMLRTTELGRMCGRFYQRTGRWPRTVNELTAEDLGPRLDLAMLRRVTIQFEPLPDGSLRETLRIRSTPERTWHGDPVHLRVLPPKDGQIVVQAAR